MNIATTEKALFSFHSKLKLKEIFYFPLKTPRYHSMHVYKCTFIHCHVYYIPTIKIIIIITTTKKSIMPYITLICEAGGARLVRVRRHYNKGMDMHESKNVTKNINAYCGSAVYLCLLLYRQIKKGLEIKIAILEKEGI